MRRLMWLLVLLPVLALAAPAAAEPQFPERGTAPVVDAANIIDPATEAALTAKLDQFEERNHRQFVVATVPDLQGYEISDYGFQLGRHWGLGDKETNDGVILLVAPTERKVRIEVGYGLEPLLTDGLSAVIIQQQILPKFKAGDMPGGIVAGTDAIITQLQLPAEEAQAIAAQAQEQPEKSGGFPIGAIFWIAFIVFFFILPMIGARARGKRYRGGGVGSAVGNVLLWSALNAASKGGGSSSGGGFGGFSGGGGGGFSGGGGSFGGGGASGGW